MTGKEKSLGFPIVGDILEQKAACLPDKLLLKIVKQYSKLQLTLATPPGHTDLSRGDS